MNRANVVTKKEIHDLRHKVDSTKNSIQTNITQEVFKEVCMRYNTLDRYNTKKKTNPPIKYRL
jgi:hypothetical protein